MAIGDDLLDWIWSDVLEIKKSSYIAFSPDGLQLAVNGTVVQIVHLPSGKPGTKCDMPKHTAYLAYSPNGERIAGLNTGGRIGICDTNSGKSILQLCDYTSEGKFVSFSPDGSQIVSAD